MKRVIVVALLAFGLAGLAPGQDVSKTPRKDGKQTSPQATASPARLDFGDQVVQTTSKPLRVILTNNTDKAIQIRSVDMSADGADFVVDDAYEFRDEALDAGKSCSIGVVFFPLLVGERTAFLLITYGNANSPQKISLKGNGIKPRGDASAGSLIR
jgi:hypothetical protein